MGGSSFTFKRFKVEQDGCAMKVGTDGVLLGAWFDASGLDGGMVLDAGTGTGLIALMAAQRCGNNTRIIGIDTNKSATEQAECNFKASPWSDRLEARHISVQEFAKEEVNKGKFEHIVCNPPFFKESLIAPDGARAMARHAFAMPISELMTAANALLSEKGRISIVMLADEEGRIESEGVMQGLRPSRITRVYTKHGAKSAKRVLMELRKKAGWEGTSTDELILGDGTPKNGRSEEYAKMTEDFYL